MDIIAERLEEELGRQLKGRPVPDSKPLSDESLRRLARHRARALATQLARPPEIESIQPLALAFEIGEEEIRGGFEKVHLEADFLPARFLMDGAERARAVCRVRSPLGLGTGFLVAPGLVMTNNHVIETAAQARDAVFEFGYADGQSTTRVSAEPDRLFITDEALDYTIVACAADTVASRPTIPLLRNPATVAPGERVCIIQHPRGRKMEVALHDNKVTELRDRVVRYTTDTEGGSSGSPVFNIHWELVGLHHWGRKERDGTATNEGVRISAIVADLIARVNGDDERGHPRLWEVIGHVPDASPYLGFFDVHGAMSELDEIEDPDHVGSRDFADVGFWNIEHFNDGINDERVEDVAQVTAKLSMDVLGLTEVQSGALDRLVHSLERRSLSYAYELLNVHGAQDIAVLYDRDTTRVVLRRDLNERFRGPLGRRAGRKKAFPREPLFAECFVDEQGQEVAFLMLVVHLKAFGDAQSRERRRVAADTLGEIVAELRREGHSVLVGGDFNEELSTGVLSGLTDAPDMVAVTAEDDVSGSISYVGRSHRSLIDHVVVSGDVRLGDIGGDDVAIVRLDQRVADFAEDVSDHVPVVVRLVYGDAGPVRDGTVVDEDRRDEPDRGSNGANGVIHIPDGARVLTVSFGPE